MVEVLAQEVLQHRQLDGAVGFGRADGGAEIANGLGRVAASPQPGERRHARIVPTAHMAILDQLQQLSLTQQRVGNVQSVKLDLLRRENVQLLNEPVVQRAMIFELQRADGMGDLLAGVGLSMGEVVHRVDAPLVAGAMMLGVQNAVHHRIANVQVRGSHVDLGAQGPRAVGKLAGAHLREQLQVLLDGAVAIRALLPWFVERTAILADFLGA